MFDRYTREAQLLIFCARLEAGKLGSPAIESEHLLLGLLQVDQTLVEQLLALSAPVESIRKRIENRVRMGEEIPTSVDLPLSRESKRVLTGAVEEADVLSDRNIRPEHLLIALLREENCLAAEVLRECGLRLADVRSSLDTAGREKRRFLGLTIGFSERSS